MLRARGLCSRETSVFRVVLGWNGSLRRLSFRTGGELAFGLQAGLVPLQPKYAFVSHVASNRTQRLAYTRDACTERALGRTQGN